MMDYDIWKEGVTNICPSCKSERTYKLLDTIQEEHCIVCEDCGYGT